MGGYCCSLQYLGRNKSKNCPLLLLSLEGKNRRRRINLEFYKDEIELRRKIYDIGGKYDRPYMGHRVHEYIA